MTLADVKPRGTASGEAIGADHRPLGERERLLNYMHRYGGLIVIQVMHLKGTIDPARLQAALEFVQRRHPMARAHVRIGLPRAQRNPPFAYLETSFHLEGTRPVPLRVTDADWQEEVSRELARPIRGRRNPRLRAVLVTGGADGVTRLMITADHASVDARTLNRLSHELLSYLANPAAAETLPSEAGGLPPAIETLLPPTPAELPYEPAQRLPRSRGPRGQVKTRVVDLHVEPEVLSGLKRAALANRTTLHAAVVSAFLTAARQLYGVTSLTCLTTLDLRRLAKPAVPNDTFGCFIDIMRVRHPIGDDFWSTARDAGLRLVTTMARNREAASILRQPDWGIYAAEAWPVTISGRRLDAFAITTAAESGLVDRYGDLALEGVTMGVGVDVVGPSLMVVGCERRGGLDLSISFSTVALSVGDATALIERATALLRGAGGTQS